MVMGCVLGWVVIGGVGCCLWWGVCGCIGGVSDLGGKYCGGCSEVVQCKLFSKGHTIKRKLR